MRSWNVETAAFHRQKLQQVVNPLHYKPFMNSQLPEATTLNGGHRSAL